MTLSDSPNIVLSNSFCIQNNKFGEQYSRIYMNRLIHLRKRLIEKVKNNWQIVPKEISELIAGEKAAVIGILYKTMPLQPTALNKIAKRLKLEPINYLDNYISKDDKIFIDDEHQRLELKNLSPNDFVSGLVVSVYGTYSADGTLYVEKHLYPGIPCDDIYSKQANIPQKDVSVLLISDLGIGTSEDSVSKLRLLVDMLTGIVEPDNVPSLLSISHVIIAGNIFGENFINTIGPLSTKTSEKANVNSKTKTESIQNIDCLLFQLSLNIPVILMPGSNDPAPIFLPQQPIHPSFFPRSASINSLHFTTNPLKYNVSGYEVIGTSGQNVKAIEEYSSLTDPLEILELTLESSIIAPSAPENLGCYQFQDTDPFIIEKCPRLYFSGSSSKYNSKIIQDSKNNKMSLLVNIPSFSQTSSCVMVNLKSLDHSLITIE